MNPRSHASVPTGTLMDLNTGRPVTVTRYRARAHVPAMQLDLAGARSLMTEILPGLCAGMAAAEAEEAAEMEVAELLAETVGESG